MLDVCSNSLQADSAQVGWLGLRVSSRLALFYIHQMNRMNSCVCDSTVYIVKSIIIIIIIIIIIY